MVRGIGPDVPSFSLSGSRFLLTELLALSGLTAIEHLDLSDTAVDDSHLDTLQKLTTLKTLDLRGTRVTPAGVAELQQHLPDTRIQTGAVRAE